MIKEHYSQINTDYTLQSRRFKFRKWAKEIGEILVSNDMPNFLVNQDRIKMKSDPLINEIENLLSLGEIRATEKYSPSAIALKILNDRCFDGETIESKKAYIVGHKLSRLADSIIGELNSYRINKTMSGNNPFYSFILQPNGDNGYFSLTDKENNIENKNNNLIEQSQEINSENSTSKLIDPLEGYEPHEIKELLRDEGEHHDNS